MLGHLHQVNTPRILRNSGALAGMVTHRGNSLNNGVTHLRPAIRPNNPHNSGVILRLLCRVIIHRSRLHSSGVRLELELGDTSRKVLVSNGLICRGRVHQCKVVEVVRRDKRTHRRHSGSSSNSNRNSRTLDKQVEITWRDEELTDEVID